MTAPTLNNATPTERVTPSLTSPPSRTGQTYSSPAPIKYARMNTHGTGTRMSNRNGPATSSSRSSLPFGLRISTLEPPLFTSRIDKNICQCYGARDEGPVRHRRSRVGQHSAGPGAQSPSIGAPRAGVRRDAGGPHGTASPEGELPPANAGGARPGASGQQEAMGRTDGAPARGDSILVRRLARRAWSGR